jgi:hypothetical protein
MLSRICNADGGPEISIGEMRVGFGPAAELQSWRLFCDNGRQGS